jgi:malto-oligosyltrehalose trehalohydrolase
MLNLTRPQASEQLLSHGPTCLADGGVCFRLWAPGQRRLQLAIEGEPSTHAMHPLSGGWHELTLPKLRAGARYRFVLPDGTKVPDPASRFQPVDVLGPSEVIATDTYEWRDLGWSGRPWHTAVLYELHVGTFSPEGTFAGVIAKLDHLVALGVTAIQLMPIAEFPGSRNWGYDGVFPFACESSYGRPDELKHLVDEAHARGLMVLLDVVYNHFGPEGNFLSTYAPQFFTDRHKTPWGAGINFDGAHSEPVRRFFIESAVRWIDEFHVDGLRLDAVHAIKDDSDTHFLDELALAVRQAARHRHIHLVLENEENQSSRLLRDASNRPRTYTAQWNDDLHHVLHVAATGESQGYYGDYAGDTEKLARALAEGFAFQGELMRFRNSPRGEPCSFLPPEAFVSFIQNHDQIGNRARGERLNPLAAESARRAIAAVYLLLPQIPMLFMGEEWDTAQPFPFFCDFNGDLAEAVRKGRRAEFAHLPEFSSPDATLTIPDPLDSNTFKSAQLDWSAISKPEHSRWLTWYQLLLTARRAEIIPLMSRLSGKESHYLVRGAQAVTVQWLGNSGVLLELNANLSSRPVSGFQQPEGRSIWLEGGRFERGVLPPWTVQWLVLDI